MEKSSPHLQWLMPVLHNHLSFILSQVLFLFLSPRPILGSLFYSLHFHDDLILSRLRLSLLRGCLPTLYLHFWPLSQASAPHCQLPLTSSICKSHQLLKLSMSDLEFLIFIAAEDLHHSPWKPGDPGPSSRPSVRLMRPFHHRLFCCSLRTDLPVSQFSPQSSPPPTLPSPVLLCPTVILVFSKYHFHPLLSDFQQVPTISQGNPNSSAGAPALL